MSPRYNFILYQWVMDKLTETQVQNAVTKGYITQEEANTIIQTPKAV